MKPRNDFAKKYKVPRNTVRYSAKKGAVREHAIRHYSRRLSRITKNKR